MPEAQKIQLLTSPTPNGWKVTILLEELREAGIDVGGVEVRTVRLDKGEQFEPGFVRVSPNQKIPGMIDGARTLFESCAILQYLGEKYPSPLFPSGERRWDILPWVYWQAANVGPAFGNKLSYTRYMDDVPEAAKTHPLERFGKEALRLARVLDRQLAGQDYVCGGELTIADISIYPWLRGYKWSKVDITGCERVMDWIARVRARPGVERGLAYGVPKEEIDSWSEERREQYRRRGSRIAANEEPRSEG